jgi:glucose 1-dehydrogenase
MDMDEDVDEATHAMPQPGQRPLLGKRALVTGSSSGIGAAIALALARAGADVVVNYRSHPDEGEAVRQQVEALGVRGLSVHADVAVPADVDALFQTVEAAWGGLDILVNNAGVDGVRQPAWESEPEQWERVLRINLFGPYHCARRALKGMVERRSGVIVNITSVHEVIPWNGYSAYCASKAGLSMMTKTLAQEAAPFGVRVLSVAPGAIQTPINQSVWGDPKMLADLLAKIPFGRMGTTEEIGRLVAVLASDDASYVTGATIFADGGMTLYPAFQHGG